MDSVVVVHIGAKIQWPRLVYLCSGLGRHEKRFFAADLSKPVVPRPRSGRGPTPLMGRGFSSLVGRRPRSGRGPREADLRR